MRSGFNLECATEDLSSICRRLRELLRVDDLLLFDRKTGGHPESRRRRVLVSGKGSPHDRAVENVRRRREAFLTC